MISRKKLQKVRTAYGAVEWIEEQKNWIAEDVERMSPGNNYMRVKISAAIYFFPINEGELRQRRHWKRNVRKKGRKMQKEIALDLYHAKQRTLRMRICLIRWWI